MRKGYKTHVSKEKKDYVASFTKSLKEYPIIGALNLENLPSAQLNTMRKKLREKNINIMMGKRRLFKIAIENVKESKKGIEQIEPYLKGMPALLFTKENPFALFKLIKKSKSKAAAKAGQVAPYDLMVSAGPTPFAPGPIISEFAQFKIKTKVVDGKVAIQEDTVVAKAGTVITDKLASLLMRLGIEPMEIGLDLVAIYENGLIYQRNVLDIDEGKFMADLECAARYAFNLSVETGYTTKENIELFLAKANMEAKALGMEANVLSPDTIGDLLAKANNQMLSVKSTLGM